MKFFGEIMTHCKKVGIFLLLSLIYTQEHFIIDIPGTGVSQPLIFSGEFANLEPGDEIGVFDLNGISTHTDDCANLPLGSVLVGAGVWTGEINEQGNALTISLIGSTYSGDVPSCDFGGFATAGYIAGNDIAIHVWSSSSDQEYVADVEFSLGNGQFGLIPSFDVISSLSWTVEEILGCTDPAALNFNPLATLNDGSCEYPVSGCMDDAAVNFNPDATEDDGSCEYLMGCTDPGALNFLPDAVEDDGSCFYGLSGCIDPIAHNYDADATMDDGSCDYTTFLSITNVDNENGSLDINMNNPVTVGGFQFDVTGEISILDIINGPDGFTISDNGQTIIGFSLTGATIDPGDGPLITVLYDNTSSIDACLGNGVISSENGEVLSSSISGCFTQVVVTASSGEDIDLPEVELEDITVDIDIPAGALDAEDGESVEIEVSDVVTDDVVNNTEDGSVSVEVESGLTIDAGDVELTDGESIEITITYGDEVLAGFGNSNSRDCPDVIMAFVDENGLIIELDGAACDDVQCSGDISEFGTYIVATETEDCSGECGGTAYSDICGACAGGSSGNAPGASLDCNGVCFGPGGSDDFGNCCESGQFVDDCGVCSDNASGHGFNSDMDCADVCFGGAVVDCSGICNGSATLDCYGVCEGGHVNDGVGDCCFPEDIDCMGSCYGSFQVDGNGECCDGDLIDPDSGLCPELDLPGCMDDTALNYNPAANQPDMCYYAPPEFAFVQTTSQGFYEIGEAQLLVDDELLPLDSLFVIGAFKGDQCVGYSQWSGGSTVIPVNGYDFVTQGTEGYLMPGDIPTFQVYDAATGEFYTGLVDLCYNQSLEPSDCAYYQFSYSLIVSMTVTQDVAAHLSFVSGNNLFSFPGLPSTSSTAELMQTLIDNGSEVNFIIGQGVGLFHLDTDGDGTYDSWSGNLNNVNEFSGYWINVVDNVGDWTVNLQGGFSSQCSDYVLSPGNNLVSYVGMEADEYSVTDALGTQVVTIDNYNMPLSDLFNFVIGQGVGLFNTGDEWSGNLNNLAQQKGYWLNIDEDWPYMAPGGLHFRWGIGNVCSASSPADGGSMRIADTQNSQADLPLEFKFTQSTEQAFYLVKSLEISGSKPSDNDMILAFNNDILTGAAYWQGPWTPVPAMGRDLSEETAGYFEHGDRVNFKYFDSSSGEMSPLDGDVETWSSLGVSTIESLSQIENIVPGELMLDSAFPNPFNPVTTITYHIPNESYITMRVYDISGRLVADLVNEIQKQGMHTIEWNAAPESSGLYLLKLSDGNEIKTNKLILVK